MKEIDGSREVSKVIQVREIEDVGREALEKLREIEQSIKDEKIDKAIHPRDRAVATLKFASTLMQEIPSIGEFLTRRYGCDNYDEAPVVVETSSILGAGDWAAVFPDGRISFISREKIGWDDEGQGRIKAMMQRQWDMGNGGLIIKVANLSKKDVVRKFQKAIKSIK